jgi:hypothetical protein
MNLRKIAFVYGHGESVPFLSILCDEVLQKGEGLVIVKDNQPLIEVNDYSFFEVYECESEEQEELVVKAIDNLIKNVSSIY